MSAVIEVNGLTKLFGNFKAVDNLSFKVEEGEVYGFIGQNGAGKSTTIRMLLDLLRPTSGTIRIFGKDLQYNRNEILRRTGAIIERPDLYTYLSGYDNLSLFARLSGVRISKGKINDQLEMVGLGGRGNDKVRVYSLGMKQRLGIAVAMVHDPDLIILDEPANGLDPQGIVDIRNLIRELSVVRKKTVLVSSHLLSEVEQVATRILIIDKGRKMVEGTVSELAHPKTVLIELETDNNVSCKDKLTSFRGDLRVELNSNNKLQIELRQEQIP